MAFLGIGRKPQTLKVSLFLYLQRESRQSWLITGGDASRRFGDPAERGLTRHPSRRHADRDEHLTVPVEKVLRRWADGVITTLVHGVVEFVSLSIDTDWLAILKHGSEYSLRWRRIPLDGF